MMDRIRALGASSALDALLLLNGGCELRLDCPSFRDHCSKSPYAHLCACSGSQMLAFLVRRCGPQLSSLHTCATYPLNLSADDILGALEQRIPSRITQLVTLAHEAQGGSLLPPRLGGTASDFDQPQAARLAAALPGLAASAGGSSLQLRCSVAKLPQALASLRGAEVFACIGFECAGSWPPWLRSAAAHRSAVARDREPCSTFLRSMWSHPRGITATHLWIEDAFGQHCVAAVCASLLPGLCSLSLACHARLPCEPETFTMLAACLPSSRLTQPQPGPLHGSAHEPGAQQEIAGLIHSLVNVRRTKDEEFADSKSSDERAGGGGAGGAGGLPGGERQLGATMKEMDMQLRPRQVRRRRPAWLWRRGEA